MPSVTRRIAQIKQPRGGYINPKLFDIVALKEAEGTLDLFPEENIHASIVGLAVDYLTRTMINQNAKAAFYISICGADMIGERDKALEMVSQIIDLTKESIILACQLSGYDVVFRAGAEFYKPVEDIIPDSKTISNIFTMVKRSLSFFDFYGPVILDGFTFTNGYTSIVDAGDGDFLTEDTLWDFKVSKNSPTVKHTLQLLMYYLMGLRSIHSEFKDIKYLGIFNPRLNLVYRYKIENIPKETIEIVERDIIGY